MSKIVLVLSVGRDIRLLRNWLAYYTPFNFDQILISVHTRPEWDPNLVAEAQALSEEFGAVVADVHTGLVSNLKNRRERMVARCCHDTDWVVMADVDEFHQFPQSPQALVNDCLARGYDHVLGHFLDRVDPRGVFPDIDETSLWDRFPVGVQLTRNLIGGTSRKVVLARATLTIVEGQHSAVNGVSCPEEKHDITVHHFKWDSTVLERAQYMIWKNSLDAQWYIIHQRRFLKHVKDNGGLNLADYRLNAFWPKYQRTRPWSDADGGLVRQWTFGQGNPIDLVYFKPLARANIELMKNAMRYVLVGNNHQSGIEISDLAALVWEQCDGTRTVAEITDALAPKFHQKYDAIQLAVQRAVTELGNSSVL